MLMLLLQFIGAAIAIVVAGTFLTHYGDAIGERTGIGRTLAGIVLLASATSLPELAVDCNLARMGQANLPLGDLLGSSLFNLLILAGLDLAHRGPTRMLSRAAASHALSATMSVVMTALVLVFLLSRFEFTFAGVGPGPIVLGVTYVLGLRLVYFDQQHAAQQLATEEQTESKKHRDEKPHLPSLNRAAVGYTASALAILLAAPWLASAAEGLAQATGLGGTFIGTTLVALSTSLPELVTTLAAVRIGAFDLAVGNIFGSNSFNMVILLPVDSFYRGSILAAASQTHAITAACAILVSSVAVIGFLYRPEKRYWVIEPDALLVIVLVVLSLALVYFLR
jgi:cation:H+ antiporter